MQTMVYLTLRAPLRTAHANPRHQKIAPAGVMGRCADMQAVHVGYCPADVARFRVWSGSVFSVHSGKDLAGPKLVRKVTKRFDVCKDRVKNIAPSEPRNPSQSGTFSSS